jgi:histidinol-phosphate aminotransferase
MSWRERLADHLPPRLRPRPTGVGLARLDFNEAAVPPSAEELAAYREALVGLELHRYPDDDATALRRALAARWGVAPEELLVGNGSLEVLATLMTAFRRPGARLLYPVPTFDQYAALAALHGFEGLPVPLGAGFQIDEPATLAAIERHRPPLAFFASPNNPTGNRFPGALLERLARRMEGAFVVDEAYADFAGRSLLPGALAVPGLFVLRSLSKLGLAGLRLGVLVGAREAIAELDRARLPFAVGAVTQALGCAALSRPAALDGRVAAIVGLRRTLEADLRQVPGLTVYPSEANFLLVRGSGDAAVLAEGLLARGVAVRDVSTLPGLTGCLRITVGSGDENRRCVEALVALSSRQAAR